MAAYAIFQSSGCAGAHPQLYLDPPLIVESYEKEICLLHVVQWSQPIVFL